MIGLGWVQRRLGWWVLARKDYVRFVNVIMNGVAGYLF